MNLPVINHIDRLSDLIRDMNDQANQTEKDLHILRGTITQLSYINKSSDQ
jgi:hypothetical protein